MLSEKFEVAKEKRKKKIHCFSKDFFFFNLSKTNAGQLTRVRNNFLRPVIYFSISLGKNHEKQRNAGVGVNLWKKKVPDSAPYPSLDILICWQQ